MASIDICVGEVSHRGDIATLKAGVIVNDGMTILAQHHAVFFVIRPAGAFPQQVVGGFFYLVERFAAMGAFSPLAQPGLGFGEVGKGHFVLLS